MSQALGSEAAFDTVLGNYLEYESDLLTGALEWLVYTKQDWAEFNDRIYHVNRRLQNLLSAARAYLDQSRHYLSRSFGEGSPELAQFGQWTGAEYDSNLAYRTLEALRNYTQHRGMAVHRLAHDRWRDGDGSGSVLRHALVPYLEPLRLQEDGGFKPSVLRELIEIGETVDLRPLARSYVAGIGRIHAKLRDLMQPQVDGAESTIESLIMQYQEQGQRDVLGLAVVERDGSGRWTRHVSIFADPIAKRRSLTARMHFVTSVERVYTSNEPNRTHK